MTHPGGRPPIYSDPKVLQEKVDLYFLQCDDPENPIPKTITGLALALGFCSRQTIYEYEKLPQFSDIIKTAMLKVENRYENAACSGNPTGPIFILKNMGWKDKFENEITDNTTVKKIEVELINGSKATDKQ